MPIAFDCPTCGVKIKAPEAAAGKRLSCPRCKEPVRVPTPPLQFKDPEPAPPPRERPEAVQRRPEPPGRKRERVEDDEPERRPRIVAEPQPQGSSAALGMGVASMVLGVISLPSGAIPCCGHVVAFPVGGIGLCLGAAGLIVSIARKGRSVGFPIAGVVLNVAALVLAGLWLSVAHGVVTDIEKSAAEAKAKRDARPDPFADQMKGGKAPEPAPKANVYLDYLKFEKGMVGEFDPKETWRFVTFLNDDDTRAVLAQPKSKTVGVVVSFLSGGIESKPTPGDPDLKIIRLLGRWRVIRFDEMNGTLLWVIEPVK